jgi:hypothetical protein
LSAPRTGFQTSFTPDFPDRDASGAFFLGRLYEERLGKTAEALKWYEAAASAGSWAGKEALDGLRERLALGLGPLADARRFEGEQDPLPYQESTTGRQGMSSKRELEQAGKRRDQWLLSAWCRNGQARFLAACIAELSDACGGLRDEWGTLTEKEQMALFNFFAVHESLRFAELGYTEETTRDALPAAARAFRETIGIGKLRATAAKIIAGL